MADKPSKEGVSIREIEEYTKNHRCEVVLCLIFILSCLFTFAMWGPGWSILCATAGAVLGIFLPAKVEYLTKKAFQFLFKQETGTQLVLAIVALILTVFIPIVYFFALGCHGGKSLRHLAMEMQSRS